MVKGLVRIVAMIGIPLAVVIGATTPALGAVAVPQSGHLKETSGAWFVGGSSLSYGSAVIETASGRAMKFTKTGGTICDAGGDCYPKGILVLTSGTNTCAGSPDKSTVVVTHCSGDTGIIWGEKTQNGHLRFINVHASSIVFNYLAGANNGTQFVLRTASPGNGFFEAFDFQ